MKHLLLEYTILDVGLITPEYPFPNYLLGQMGAMQAMGTLAASDEFSQMTALLLLLNSFYGADHGVFGSSLVVYAD
ncbi:MAG: hypothetical protein ACLVHE_03260 [Dialister invisus]